ncbi:hypothetical protein [Stenotrophomonas sp. NPDC077659]|uniref:hypothetical protein n=1 Tax=Stenotrophomonas sp. NPDC077659 TaxID=3390694 RepID=UPI003CFD0291
MLLSLLLAVVPVTTIGAYDEVQQTDDGRTLVLRTIDWETEDGERTRVTVHWLLLDDGSMMYEYARQPPATQAVHRRACALAGGTPSTGVSFLAGPGTTHGFGCTGLP